MIRGDFELLNCGNICLKILDVQLALWGFVFRKSKHDTGLVMDAVIYVLFWAICGMQHLN